MELVTTQEAARILGGNKPIPRSTLAVWRKTGIGPEFIQFGRTIRYPLEGIVRFLEQNRVGAAEDSK